MTPLTPARNESLKRLAALVIQRRTALGWTKEKAAEAAGVAYMTYDRVENGKGVQARTYGRIETALDVRPGGCAAVLNGADSLTLTDGTELLVGAKISQLDTDRLDGAIRDAVTSAAILTKPELTGGELQKLGDALVEELQRRGILPGGP